VVTSPAVAIASIPPAVIDDARFEQLGSRVLEDVTPKLDQLRIDTTTTIDTRLATVDARIADGLRASIGPVAEELRTSLTTAVATPLASRLSQLEGAVATSQESFDQLTGRLQTLNTFTREQLAVIDVDRLRLDTELRRIDTESSGLVERIGSLREELVVINPDVIHRIPVFERFRPPHQ
jgi:chromosome segregation ATPase